MFKICSKYRLVHSKISDERKINRAFFALGTVWIILQIPFLKSAFRIDEPLVLAIADHIRQSPFDPYGITINWLGTPEFAFAFYANPPLMAYWISAWSLVFPWNEVSLHTAILPFSLLSLYGFDLISRAYKVDRLMAGVMLCCSPTFFLSSQVVMPDIAMFAFLLVSLGCALWYEAEGRLFWLALASVAGLLCPLAKYNGLIVIPILGFIWLFSKRKAGLGLILACPIASIALWSLLSFIRYGSPHIVTMSVFQQTNAAPRLIIFVGVLCALSLAVVPLCAVCSIPESYRRKKFVFILQSLTGVFFYLIGVNLKFGRPSAILFALAAFLFTHLITLTFEVGIRAFKQHNHSRLLLVLWVFVGIVFQAGLMFSSARYVLFLGPPSIILFLLECKCLPHKKALGCVIAANFAFVLSVAVADYRTAEAYRWVTENHIEPARSSSHGDLFFSGHWGLQYYLESAGGQHVTVGDTNPLRFRSGDLLIVAETAWSPIMKPPVQFGQRVEIKRISFNPAWPLRTIDCGAAANFYSCINSRCPLPAFLPFGFAQGNSEVFVLYTFK